MPDDEGFLFPGELQLGAYAALEGDVGESVMWPLGFVHPVGEGLDEERTVRVVGGWSTVPGEIRFVCPEQVLTWRRAYGG